MRWRILVNAPKIMDLACSIIAGKPFFAIILGIFGPFIPFVELYIQIYNKKF